MADIFTDLARHLDTLPAGFPATDTGVELTVLRKLFTEDEAKIALALTMLPEPAAAIAQRLSTDETALSPALDDMAKKGLIFRSARGGAATYMAAQFVIGIWEYHLKSLDRELIEAVNAYLPFFMTRSWARHHTKQLRVIPVSRKITARMEIMPYEAAEEIIQTQSKIVISECICRKEHQMVGKGCDYPMEACFSFGSGAFFYEENGLGRAIDQEEALKILARGQEAGLVLQPGNAKKPANICMCCGCCCQVLSNLKTLDQPALAVHSNYYARVDEDACVGCGACADRCHMDAIDVADTARVNPGRCIGCGVCIDQCPTAALEFLKKDSVYEPPANVFDTYLTMARERGLM